MGTPNTGTAYRYGAAKRLYAFTVSIEYMLMPGQQRPSVDTETWHAPNARSVQERAHRYIMSHADVRRIIW